jgi:outer membrane protein OmpA-like peptidoglycan-associated protein
MTFALHFAHPDSVKAWNIAFSSQDGTVVQQIKGNPSQFPPAVTWDGTASDGRPAAEGTYIAKLTVDHGGNGGTETVQTDPILLDRTPASGTITVTPQPYSPGDPTKIMDGPSVTFTVNVTPGIAPVSSWRLFVVHPNGSQFMSFISEEHKNNVVIWNGRAQDNAMMEAGTVYNVTAQIFDRYGNVGNLKTTLQVGMISSGPRTAQAVKPAMEQTQEAPVTVSLDGNVVAQTNIYFPAYSADMTKVDNREKTMNSRSLDALAVALKAANGSKIKVVGHANKVFWQDQRKGDREQRFVLIPLSEARAKAVETALVARGLDAALFDLDGVGAIGAAVPFGDLVNNWKNRRVEFNVES